MSATDDIDIRRLLEQDPEEVVRKYRHVALRLADKHRRQGEDEFADEIERRVQLAEEGGSR